MFSCEAAFLTLVLFLSFHSLLPTVNKEALDILYNEQSKAGGQGFKMRFIRGDGKKGEWKSCKYSPIAFDLNGSGKVENITRAEGYQIDVTGDGDLETIGEWFAPTEGILIDLQDIANPHDNIGMKTRSSWCCRKSCAWCSPW